MVSEGMRNTDFMSAHVSFAQHTGCGGRAGRPFPLLLPKNVSSAKRVRMPGHPSVNVKKIRTREAGLRPGFCVTGNREKPRRQQPVLHFAPADAEEHAFTGSEVVKKDPVLSWDPAVAIGANQVD